MRHDASGADIVGSCGGGGDGDPSRRRRWPFIALALIVVAVSLGSWLDNESRHREFDALLAKAADAQAVAAAAQGAVLATRKYTMPLLVTSSSAAVRTGLEELIDQSAAKGEDQLRDARDTLAKVSVLPWHHKMDDAKAAALAYFDRRLADFASVAGGADLALLSSDKASAEAATAASALRDAAPSTTDAARAGRTFAS